MVGNSPPAGPQGTPAHPSDRILTVPNLITFGRLALVPVFLWLALGPEADLAAVAVGSVIFATDYLDGIAARRLKQVSRLGITLDPLFDRIAIAAVGTVLILREIVPWPAVAAVVGRDLLLLLAVPLLASRGVARPSVSRTGKTATFLLMPAFGLLYASVLPGPPLERWVEAAGWALYAPGLVLSYLAAAGYARDAVRAVRGRGTSPRVR